MQQFSLNAPCENSRVINNHKLMLLLIEWARFYGKTLESMTYREIIIAFEEILG
jgi:hypothetical protein